MDLTSNAFLERAAEALEQPERARCREALGFYIPRLRGAAVSAFGDFEGQRQALKALRQHSLEHLDHYLQRYVEQSTANGCQVHFARDGEELNAAVLAICEQHEARRIIKGKSMVTEETGLNAALEAAGLTVRETDLGEYIIQEAGEKPSHIVGPALHKPEAEIRELFLARHDLGERKLPDAASLVAEARQILREDFLSAEVGIIGSNALVADTGDSLLITNEGNGDLCANLPRVLVVCTTVDRILPGIDDALAMQRLLVRSTTGQPVTCYTSFYGGPRRPGDLDGPEEMHVVLLDNGRSELLDSRYREMLQCIRCGTCLDHCPVYVAAGGHAYGSTYPGPMGSVLTPLLASLEDSQLLPNACTACGRCAEVCPASIPLPDLLRDLRAEEFERGLISPAWQRGLKLHSWLARQPRLYRVATNLGLVAMRVLARGKRWLRHLPFAGGWLEARDFPVPQGRSFQSQRHRERRRRAV